MKSLLFTILVVLLGGCSAQVDVIGKFDDYSDIFKGFVISNGTGNYRIEMVSDTSKIKCAGNGYLIYWPPTGGCVAGYRGKAPLTCSDGRKLEVDFLTTGCATGYGRGRDQNGAALEFVFGSNGVVAGEKLAEMLKSAASSEPLPVYRPKEVRKEKGFSTGTGFFVTDDGVIITNYHVIEGSKNIVVIRPDAKTEYVAEVMQVDAANDVAILKIQAVSIPLAIASSADAIKGQEILTLGYPLVAIQGQEQKATFGRINALTGLKDDVRLLQIDASIQPGNSGGPLLNKRGEVIGVVTSTLSSIATLRVSGSFPQNVNFAVKSDYILPTLRAAMKNYYTPLRGFPSEQAMERVVAAREPSVVLVIAR